MNPEYNRLLGALTTLVGAELEKSGSALPVVSGPAMSSEGPTDLGVAREDILDDLADKFSGGYKRSLNIQDRGVAIDRDATLVLDINRTNTDLELPRLRRILRNAADIAERARLFVDRTEVLSGTLIGDKGGNADKRERAQVLRGLHTSRDSLRQLCWMLAGEDLDNVTVLPEQSMQIDMTEWHGIDVDIASASHDKAMLALAEVYNRLKKLREEAHRTEHVGEIRGAINDIMNYISEGSRNA